MQIFKKLEELQIKAKELLIFLMRRMKIIPVFQELISIRENIADKHTILTIEEEKD